MSFGTSIQNIGDFYSEHYLESTFSKDLKKIKDQWKELGARSPAKRLGGLGKDFFNAKGEALEIQELERRIATNGQHEYLSKWHGRLLDAIGYTPSPGYLPVDDGASYVPILDSVERNGKPWLVIVEAPFCLSESSLLDGMSLEEPLEICPLIPFEAETAESSKLIQETWGKAIGKLFYEDPAPRWAMLLAGSVVLLFDREKYAQGRYLQFDFEDLLGRKESEALLATAALLSRQTLCPDADEGEVLHDSLEDNSHKFAYGVSDSLQLAVREAIELIANEWVDARRRKSKSYTRATIDGIERAVTAEDLRHEALVYVYRLLFCFFAEARGDELGILPLNDDIYRLGYSLENLRDLENVPLNEEARAGFYFHEHLSRLFSIIHNGYADKGAAIRSLNLDNISQAFEIKPLAASLFDPAQTPLLSTEKLRNDCLQKVIRGLSLSTHDRTGTVGRVNYAELGINQLGAVYEGLLSYRGMFASEDLIQVKNKAEDIKDKKTASWFVSKERLNEFKRDEVVRTAGGLERIYKKGEFILHLSGIDREKSASYYTPEVLTKCLVEEALRELLKDYTPADADKILDLKVCEPAMGSGAFLNEAASQLALKYLELKQKQLGIDIEVSRLPEEHRRVKHYIACRNIYGVDLNPTAVELGALSLWLGSIHSLRIKEDSYENNGQQSGADYSLSAVPWFGLRLRAGNSIIGARRAVWTDEQLRNSEHVGTNGTSPRNLEPGERRKPNEVYHFLVFDDEMVPAARERQVRAFLRDECDAVKNWHSREVKPRWDAREFDELAAYSDLIDKHFEEYAKERATALEQTKVTATVWPIEQESSEAHAATPKLSEQEEIRKALESSSGSFQRLKLIMDAWCAFWFFPVDAELPSREAWLAAVQIILGDKPLDKTVMASLKMRLGFDLEILSRASSDGVPDTEAIAAAVSWLGTASKIAKKELFFHWELSFPEVLSEFSEKGFDLVLGNPPWIGAGWSAATVAYDFDPAIGVIKAKSAPVARAIRDLLGDTDHRSLYINRFTSSEGVASFLSSSKLYPELLGGRTNLYKNFIVLSWGLIGKDGIGALLHPEGVYDETKGWRLRKEYYPALAAHFQFRNAMFLFADVHDGVAFSLNIFGSRKAHIRFRNIVNLFHPATISSCLAGTSQSICPGIKTDGGDWELRGHPSRLVEVAEDELRVFAKIFRGNEDDWATTPIPQVHSKEVLEALRKFTFAKALSQTEIDFVITTVFNETTAQESGEITRQDSPSFQPQTPEDVILTGPLFFVGNPAYKTARDECTHNNAYDDLDLTELPEDFLPRTVYKPGDSEGDRTRFEQTVRSVGVNSKLGKPIVGLPRMGYRLMASISGERTLTSTIFPSGFTSIHGVMFLCIDDIEELMLFNGTCNSVVFDFLTKVKGRTNIYGDDLTSFPIVSPPYRDEIIWRNARLVCLTKHYAKVWKDSLLANASPSGFSSKSDLLENDFEISWNAVNPQLWEWKSALRTDFSRRQALLEIDVLTAMALDISLEELLTIYRVQFPVFRQYELVDEYDQRGRRLPNTARKTPGAKELRDARKELGDKNPITVSWQIDNGNQTVTKTFYPPFEKFDREEDYAEAYDFFKKRFDS